MGLYQGNIRLSSGGKTAYQQAVEGGYQGSEEEFSQLLGSMDRSLQFTQNGTGMLGNSLNGLCYGDGKYVGPGSGGNIYYSTDGAHWNVAPVDFGSRDPEVDQIIYGNGVFVCEGNLWGDDTDGDEERVIGPCYSTDGVHWAACTFDVTLSPHDYHLFVYGAEKFLCITEDGKVITSADGISWTNQDCTGTLPYADHGYLTYGNGQFVGITSDDDDVVYSADGLTWTTGSSLSSVRADVGWSNIVYAGGRFLAWGSYYDEDGNRCTAIAYSTDGLTWENGTIADVPTDTKEWTIEAICYGEGMYVAAVSYDDAEWDTYIDLFYSTDGAVWQKVPNWNVVQGWYSALCYGDHFVFTYCQDLEGRDDRECVACSTDGLRWDIYTGETTLTYPDGKDASAARGIFVVHISDYENAASEEWEYIADKTSYEIIDAVVRGMFAIAIYNENEVFIYECYESGSVYFVAGSGGTVHSFEVRYDGRANWETNEFLTTDDISSGYAKKSHTHEMNANAQNGWVLNRGVVLDRTTETIADEEFKTIQGACYGNGVYCVACAGNGAPYIKYSTDAKTWVKAEVAEGKNFYASFAHLCFGNGVFLCTGSYETDYYYSTDGITWTPQDSYGVYTSSGLVFYCNDRFISLYDDETCYYSFDGLTWTEYEYPFETDVIDRFYDAVYSNGMYCLVGSARDGRNSCIAYSTDFVSWSLQYVYNSQHCGIMHTVCGDNAYGTSAFPSTYIGRLVINSSDGAPYFSIDYANLKAERGSVWCHDNKPFVLMPNQASILYKPSGDWLTAALPVSREWKALLSDGTTAVLMADDCVLTSTDGITWTGNFQNALLDVGGNDIVDDMKKLLEVPVCSVLEATIDTDWTEDTNTGVKTQTIVLDGVTSANNAKVDVRFASEKTSDGYAEYVEQTNQYLTYITNGFAETVDGGIQFTIFGDANTVNIPIVVEVS